MQTFNTAPAITMDTATQVIVENSYGDFKWQQLVNSFVLYVHLNGGVVTFEDFVNTRCDMPKPQTVFHPTLCEEWDINIEYMNTKEKLYVKIDNVLYEVFETHDENIVAVHPDAIFIREGEDDNVNYSYFTAPLETILAQLQ